MGGHWLELLIVVIVGLALFGPKTLQSLGRNAGRGIGQAKDIKDKVVSELKMDEIHQMSQSIPTSPRHAVQMLLSNEQKAKQTEQTEQSRHTVQTSSEDK